MRDERNPQPPSSLIPETSSIIPHASPVRPRPRRRLNQVIGSALTLFLLGAAVGVGVTIRNWKRGDTIHLTLPMPARRIVAYAGVKEDAGKAALQRGPLVYALEAIDNGGSSAAGFYASGSPTMSAVRRARSSSSTALTASRRSRRARAIRP